MKILSELTKISSTDIRIIALQNLTELEKKVFYYTYNPHYKYHITNIPLGPHLGEPTEDMFNLLDKLRTRQLTGHMAKHAVETFIQENGSLIAYICNKNLNCKVSALTFNKAYPKYIPTFKIQLAKEIPIADITYPAFAQLKYDGVRLITIVTNNGVSFYTRSGKQINIEKLQELFLQNKILPGVYDGELVSYYGKVIDRTKISGKVNSAFTSGNLSLNNMTYIIFDTILLNAFETVKTYYVPYEIRFNRVKSVVEQINNDLIIAPLNKVVNNVFDVTNFYTEVSSQGYEGLVIKDPTSYYHFSRHKSWAKVKAIKEIILTCVDINQGKSGTKYANLIGSLICMGNIDSIKVIVSVGSGLSDYDRQKDINKFIGKKIRIKYNTEIPNKEKTCLTLFLPRFEGIV